MNNKGFTLIELILVISVLAMIALLSAPNVIKMLEKNKADNYNSTIDSIIEAAEIYVSDNRYNDSMLHFNTSCNLTESDIIEGYITLKDLINSKDITSPVKNFCTDEEFNEETKIIVTLDCNTKQYNYDIDDESSGTLVRRIGEENPVLGIDGIKIEVEAKSNKSYIFYDKEDVVDDFSIETTNCN